MDARAETSSVEPANVESANIESGGGGWSFAVRLAAGVGVQLVLLAALALYYPVSDQHYLAGSVFKRGLMEATPSPRVVVTGGSGTAFGYDSALVESRTGVSTVNLGLHASFNSDHILSEVKRYGMPGDTVVVALEHHMFQDARPGIELLQFIIEWSPEDLTYLNKQQVMTFLDTGHTYVSRMILRCLNRAQGKGEPFFPYRVDRLSERGDVLVESDEVINRARVTRPSTFRYRASMVEERIGVLNRFIGECRGRGIRVLYTHPPMARSAFEGAREDLERLDEALHAGLDAPIVLSLSESILDDDDFYNTYYHPNSRGRRVFTERFAERLASLIDDHGG